MNPGGPMAAGPGGSYYAPQLHPAYYGAAAPGTLQQPTTAAGYMPSMQASYPYAQQQYQPVTQQLYAPQHQLAHQPQYMVASAPLQPPSPARNVRALVVICGVDYRFP
jgi:hypothetical protein